MTDTALAARTRTRDADRTTTAAIRFADLGISPRVVDALAKRGLTEAVPIQSLVMPDALAGRDILAKSRTGRARRSRSRSRSSRRSHPRTAHPRR